VAPLSAPGGVAAGAAAALLTADPVVADGGAEAQANANISPRHAARDRVSEDELGSFELVIS